MRLLFTSFFLFLCFLPSLGQELSEAEKEKKRLALLEDLKEARFYVDEKDYPAAHKKFSEILKEYPNNLDAHLGILNTYGSEKNKAELTTYSDKAMSKNKGTSLGGLTIQAVSKMWARDKEGAAEDFTKATEAYPEKAYVAQYYLGYLKYRSRKVDEALPFLLEAVKINENYAEAYYLLGDIYYGKKDKTKMIKYWNEYLKRIPKEGSRYERVNKIFKQYGG